MKLLGLFLSYCVLLVVIPFILCVWFGWFEMTPREGIPAVLAAFGWVGAAMLMSSISFFLAAVTAVRLGIRE